MKTKPFNLEAAKRGEPVVTRDGREAKYSYTSEEKIYPHAFEMANEPGYFACYRDDGVRLTHDERDDLFMLDITPDAPVEPKLSYRVVDKDGNVVASFPSQSLCSHYLQAFGAAMELTTETFYLAQKAQQSGVCGVFVPKKGEGFYTAGQHLHLGTLYSAFHVQTTDLAKYGFRTKQAADDWAFAMNVMLQMRVQPGAETAVDEKNQWFIGFHDNLTINILWCYGLSSKIENASFGIFAIEEAAQRAIAAVGAENITKAAKILAGLGGQNG